MKLYIEGRTDEDHTIEMVNADIIENFQKSAYSTEKCLALNGVKVAVMMSITSSSGGGLNCGWDISDSNTISDLGKIVNAVEQIVAKNKSTKENA